MDKLILEMWMKTNISDLSPLVFLLNEMSILQDVRTIAMDHVERLDIDDKIAELAKKLGGIK